MAELFANSGDPDQTPHSMGVSRLQYIKDGLCGYEVHCDIIMHHKRMIVIQKLNIIRFIAFLSIKIKKKKKKKKKKCENI